MQKITPPPLFFFNIFLTQLALLPDKLIGFSLRLIALVCIPYKLPLVSERPRGITCCLCGRVRPLLIVSIQWRLICRSNVIKETRARLMSDSKRWLRWVFRLVVWFLKQSRRVFLIVCKAHPSGLQRQGLKVFVWKPLSAHVKSTRRAPRFDWQGLTLCCQAFPRMDSCRRPPVNGGPPPDKGHETKRMLIHRDETVLTGLTFK